MKIIDSDGNIGYSGHFAISVAGITPCPETPTVLYEEKTYNTVQIGEQCWLKENLNIGTMIESNSGDDNQTDNSIIEKNCYGNDETNCDSLGGLYQWDEAMQYTTDEGVKGICPDGWHIPTYCDMETLSNSIGGEGNSLKKIGQGAGTNISGFSALLAGSRASSTGTFGSLGSLTNIFLSSRLDDNPYFLSLLPTDTEIYLYPDISNHAYSIRCLKY